MVIQEGCRSIAGWPPVTVISDPDGTLKESHRIAHAMIDCGIKHLKRQRRVAGCDINYRHPKIQEIQVLRLLAGQGSYIYSWIRTLADAPLGFPTRVSRIVHIPALVRQDALDSCIKANQLMNAL